MGFLRIGAMGVLFFLSGCAFMRPAALPDCTRDSSLARGARDGAHGSSTEADYVGSCAAETREMAHLFYRKGFEAARSKRVRERERVQTVQISSEFSLAQEALAVRWICEVEANSKIFTGVGFSRDEALGSARASCGSHLQTAACTIAECKQNL